MTLVIAKRFGQRIIIASDTMISDQDGGADDRIPGRLKAVVLDSRTSVAYAGATNQANDAIRRAKRILAEGGTLSEVEGEFRVTARRYAGELEFALASHWDKPSLKKIWDGRVSFDQDQVCLGQTDLLHRFEAEMPRVPRSCVPSEFDAELPFLGAFRKLFDGIHISDVVGGFGFLLLASPHGHCYQNEAGVATWDAITIGQPLTETQQGDRRSGMTQWGFHTCSPELRGVGVTGALVLDAGVGFIYSPLTRDEPTRWRFTPPMQRSEHPALLHDFQRQVDAAADAVGGGIKLEFPPPRNVPPTDAELQEVNAYAAAALLPTQVELRTDGLWIQCGTGFRSRGFMVAFASLDPDPVEILKTAVDRVNAELISPR